MKRVRAQGQRPVCASQLGQRAGRYRQPAAGHCSARPDAAQAILPYSYAGTMGLVQGDSMAARFFHQLGASLLDRTICASAGAEALTQTLGGKLGMRVEFFAEAKLILIWAATRLPATCTSGAMRKRPSGAAPS